MNEPFRLDGLMALVTGASRGIGRAIAVELARAGARVGIHFVTRREMAAGLLAEIGGESAGAIFGADLATVDGARRLAAEARDTLGPIDIVVHNAGVWNDRPIDLTDTERLNGLLALNLSALFHLTGPLVPDMKKRQFGRIIGISSTAALLGEPGHSHYAASKGGLEAWSRSLAVELGPFGITCNTVAPGWTATDMVMDVVPAGRLAAIAEEIPTRRLAEPRDIGWAVRFLASEEARHVNGVCLPVEGGYRWRR